jgi:tRNA threonylcarbamoyladenosine biosynthesis protein TsaE
MNEITFTLQENELGILLEKISNIIQDLIKIEASPCILLSGDLGTGKTTFVREWLHYVGSKDLANSPTFALHNIYEWQKNSIHHFDLYRIKDKYELEHIGFEEIWGKEGISFIEWWSIADHIIPQSNRIYISIDHLNPDKRKYVIRYNNL